MDRLQRFFGLPACALYASLAAAPLGAATITVTDAGDTIAVDGKVTLREAITSIENAANVNADVVPSGAYGTNDTIAFNIAPSGTQISLFMASALPAITKALTIDGTSQAGFTGTPLIFLDGLSAGSSTDGLAFSNHSGSVVRSLGIVRFGGNGIVITGTGGGHTIAGNWIGVNGTTPLGNGGDGIKVSGVPNNRIGGTVAADRNVISDNGQSNVFGGVELTGAGATGNVVEGNYIGLDPAGTVALGNSKVFGYGVILVGGAHDNTIGGTAAGAGNVISDNGGGLTIQGADANSVQGNRIGTDAAGIGARGNHGDGVSITGTSGNNVLGGTVVAARNIVSGNSGNGVLLGGCQFSGSGNAVKGNFIGVDANGGALGNGGDGVRVNVDQHDAEISGNQIALNSGNGVGIKSDDFCGPLAHGIAILGNQIHHNGGLGIDLGLDGVTANDALDADPGVNGLQNYPVLTAATSNGVTITVTGTLNSVANSTYRLEFFANPSCTPSAAEGQEFMGSHDVTTDASGNASFAFPFPAPAFVKFVTSTATDAANDTSEFSVCQAVVAAANHPPVASDDAYSTPFQTALSVPAPGVLGNDSDADGDPITAVLDGSPSHGSLALNPDGSFLYTPSAGFAGVDTFTYHANDTLADSNVATVTITVLPSIATGIPVLDLRGWLAMAILLGSASLWLLRRR